MLFTYILLLHGMRTELHGQCSHPCSRGGLSDVAYGSWREQWVVQALLDQPNLSLRPTPFSYNNQSDAPSPVLIWTSLYLESISSVKEQNMEFKAQFRFNQEWLDERLSFSDAYFVPPFDYVHFAKDQIEVLWRPDTFFQNEKDGHYHMEDQPNFSFLVRSDGNIVYNRRMSMVFSCVMSFIKYPMDSQQCEIDFASYAYTTSDIIYVWKEKPLTIYHDAISTLPNFVIKSFTNGTCSSITNTGEYSCLKVVLSLQRNFSFFLLQVYLPLTTLVAVAWISFWIDWQATAARFPLVLFTLLTVVAQGHVISSNLPPVSYTKALDVWTGTCVVFTFASMLEYAFVNYTALKEFKPKQRSNWRAEFGRNMWDRVIAWGANWKMCLSSQRRRRRLIRFPNKTQGCLRTKQRTRVATDSLWHDCRLDVFMDNMEDPEQSDPVRVQSEMTTGDNTTARRRPSLFGRYSSARRHCVYIGKFRSYLKMKSRAERIDFMFRLLYPIAFGMFNVVYWSAYW